MLQALAFYSWKLRTPISIRFTWRLGEHISSSEYTWHEAYIQVRKNPGGNLQLGMMAQAYNQVV